jgi:hypothetical protein
METMSEIQKNRKSKPRNEIKITGSGKGYGDIYTN